MNYSSLLRIITPPSTALLLIVVLMLAGSAVALAQPWLAGLVAERIIDPAAGGLGGMLLAWLALAAGSAIIGLLSTYLVGATGEDMAANLRTRVYEHLQSLPMDYFQARKQGEVSTPFE